MDQFAQLVIQFDCSIPGAWLTRNSCSDNYNYLGSYFQVLATEEPRLQVLAWSPGPLEGTDMSTKVRTETGDAATRQMFEQLQASDSYVRCDSSANKMIETLLKNDFKSGAHIDYFD